MSYVKTPPLYYQQFQIDTPLEEGAMGWTRAPWPGWGQNPNLTGPKRIAIGASPDGLGAYYRNVANQAIGADDAATSGLMLASLLAFTVLGGAVLLAGAHAIGKSAPARRR